MTRRTPEEIKAYIDGYNDCFNRFCECLKGRKSVMDAIRKMRVCKDLVNRVVEAREESE